MRRLGFHLRVIYLLSAGYVVYPLWYDAIIKNRKGVNDYDERL